MMNMSEMDELKKRVELLSREVEELKKIVYGKPKESFSMDVSRGVGKAVSKFLEDSGEESIFVCAGVIKEDGKVKDSWSFDYSLDEVFEIHPSRIVRLLSPLTSEQRIKILRIILRKRPISMSQLSEETGLEGGELYHHLRELMRRDFIRLIKRGTYAITPKGEIALIVASGMAFAWEPSLEEELENKDK
ncbi:MAG: winged helix-turn-helix transcriptional regulator [Thermoproteales archaeon]|nr:winged helix-turn-helix transcriptional regulator [Thermoproteales archaeon]